MAGQGLGQLGARGTEADNGPGDTHTPVGAVRAFLSALKAKDRDRLSDATAAHAASNSPVETVSKNKDLFGKIIDGSISDSELDDIAKKLDGFHVAGENAVKSTGRAGVYADKPNDSGGFYRRTFTLRKEKKGWGIMDISPPTEFKGGPGARRSKAATRY
jgi:hypothetical protein